MSYEIRILNKLDELADGIKRLEILHAELPHKYVPRAEIEETKRNALIARRWAIALWVPVLVNLGLLVATVM